MPRENISGRSAKDIALLFLFGIVVTGTLMAVIWLCDVYRVPDRWRDFILINSGFIGAVGWSLRKRFAILQLRLWFSVWVIVHVIAYLKLMNYGVTGLGCVVPFLPEVVLISVFFAWLSNKPRNSGS